MRPPVKVKESGVAAGFIRARLRSTASKSCFSLRGLALSNGFRRPVAQACDCISNSIRA